MNNLSGEMRHKVAVYGRKMYIDECGGRKYKYDLVKYIWCAIIPITDARSRKTEKVDNVHMTKSFLSIKFLARINAIDIRNDMYLIYRGQKYDVECTIPYFKNMQYQEIYAKLRIENDDNALTLRSDTVNDKQNARNVQK